MTAQNLALVFVPTLFQDDAMNTNMVRLTRDLIIHYTLIFQASPPCLILLLYVSQSSPV